MAGDAAGGAGGGSCSCFLWCFLQDWSLLLDWLLAACGYCLVVPLVASQPATLQLAYRVWVASLTVAPTSPCAFPHFGTRPLCVRVQSARASVPAGEGPPCQSVRATPCSSCATMCCRPWMCTPRTLACSSGRYMGWRERKGYRMQDRHACWCCSCAEALASVTASTYGRRGRILCACHPAFPCTVASA